MDIAKDIKDRIVNAANSLYEEGQRADFPTVAAVGSNGSQTQFSGTLNSLPVLLTRSPSFTER